MLAAGAMRQHKKLIVEITKDRCLSLLPTFAIQHLVSLTRVSLVIATLNVVVVNVVAPKTAIKTVNHVLEN